MPWVRTQIAQYRIKAGFKSGQDAADKLGVSLIHVREIERGASGVSADLAAGMAKAYGKSVAEILRAVRTARFAFHRRAIKNL